MQAHNQWASRPDDERFTSLIEMQLHFAKVRSESKALTVSTRRLQAQPRPTESGKGIDIVGPNGHGYEPTHWAFGQLAGLAGAPGGYLRTLPPEMACDCLNYGLQYTRDIEEIGVLLQKNGSQTLRAATGPKYGRIWNNDVVDSLVNRFGDGITGQWKVPGEFGQDVVVTKANTTLYASDRDFFVFLADERNRVTIPNRRDGKDGDLARGFFVWNSEVGAATFGVASFLFDFVCCNRMIWGAAEFNEIRIRHTVSAPDRFLEEITPALKRYSESSTASVTTAIEDARKDRLNDVDEFLAKRFGKGMVASINKVHEIEEGRPIETRWDAVVGATARAKAIEYQDARVELERAAGSLLSR
jgi:Domain of unknown function (DUF932)